VEEHAVCVGIFYAVLGTHTRAHTHTHTHTHTFVHLHTVCMVVIMQGLCVLVIAA